MAMEMDRLFAISSQISEEGRSCTGQIDTAVRAVLTVRTDQIHTEPSVASGE